MDVMITAQEILVDNASYPTEKIAANSHDFRPLGLGYANLGALLMASGLPYDSDAGPRLRRCHYRARCTAKRISNPRASRRRWGPSPATPSTVIPSWA